MNPDMYLIFQPDTDPLVTRDASSASGALEQYQQLYLLSEPERTGRPKPVVYQQVDVRRLFESVQSVRRVVNVTPASDVQEAAASKDYDRVALPGQFAPMVYEEFVPVHAERPNDCAVVAAANVFRLSYKEARVATFQYGWSSTRGISTGFLELMAEAYGLLSWARPDLAGGLVRNFSAPGVLLVYCDGHVMPSINGRLLNLAGCDLRVVREVFEFQPSQASCPTL